MQLSAWTSSTEKTVMAASDTPEALPELNSEAGTAAASKGLQQITGWQVLQHSGSSLMILKQVASS